MRLAQFIAMNTEQIGKEWEKFAATLQPAASTMSLEERRDHVEAILRRVSEDLKEPQTSKEQSDKAHGKSDVKRGENSAAKSHGAARAESGYTADQMVSEFRALRACVVRLWLDQMNQGDRQVFDDLTRFHEAIDQALAESVRSFTKNVDHAKELFLGVLGHDLRTPLAAVMMGATMMLTEEGANWQRSTVASRILNSGTRMEKIIGDLLDFTRGRLGSGIPVTCDEMDLDALLRQNIDELSGVHERCRITFTSPKPVIGIWDRARLGQVMANLIGNACQHGAAGGLVEISLSTEGETAVVAIHNKGTMIPPHLLRTIFEPFRRLGSNESSDRTSNNSIGLGLYIVKAIVSAHHGTIDVTSAEDGTTFTVRLPRRSEESRRGDAPEAIKY